MKRNVKRKEEMKEMKLKLQTLSLQGRLKVKIMHNALYFKPVVMLTLILALKLAFTLTLMLPLILT